MKITITIDGADPSGTVDVVREDDETEAKAPVPSGLGDEAKGFDEYEDPWRVEVLKVSGRVHLQLEENDDGSTACHVYGVPHVDRLISALQRARDIIKG